jgi:rhodanese-related sulfurtransferase
MSQISPKPFRSYLNSAILILVVTPSLIALSFSHAGIERQNALILDKLDKLTTSSLATGTQKRMNQNFVNKLEFKDKVEGEGKEAVSGMSVKLEYTGKLIDGTVFDTSKGKKPLEFIIGTNTVVPGFEKGVMGMKVGGVRTVNIPPELAYGSQGVPGVIPPNSVLIFEIELISASMVKENAVSKEEKAVPIASEYKNINNQELKELLDKNTVLIDIRRPEEWKETGVISGAHTLTLYDSNGKEVPGFLNEFIKLVPTKETPVILICRTGNRTSFAAKAFSELLGYKNIYHAEKGMVDWISSGNKVEKYTK